MNTKEIIAKLRHDADFAHAVTGCSLRDHICTIAANELEVLNEMIEYHFPKTSTPLAIEIDNAIKK